MSWSRRPQPDDQDPDSEGRVNPLADKMRFGRNRASNDATQPLDADHNAQIYDQHTVVDNNFAGRAQTRKQRQASPFNTRQLGTWAANPDSTRWLWIAGAALMIFLLLLLAINVYNRLSSPAASEEDLPFASDAPAGGVIIEDPAASADPGLGTVPQPVETVAGTDPAQQPAAPPSGGAFVVSGTGVEGLFLRPEPSTNQPPITTLPEGTRVEATGEVQSDGTYEWRRVVTPQGEGWVASQFLQPAQ
jgi:hypothetical protein